MHVENNYKIQAVSQGGNWLFFQTFFLALAPGLTEFI